MKLILRGPSSRLFTALWIVFSSQVDIRFDKEIIEKLLQNIYNITIYIFKDGCLQEATYWEVVLQSDPIEHFPSTLDYGTVYINPWIGFVSETQEIL